MATCKKTPTCISHMHISPSQPLHPLWTKRHTSQVLCVPMVRSEFHNFPCSDKPKRFKTRNIGEKKQDHLPMIQATHGNSCDSKKKNSRNLQVMPSWIKISWNKCSLGRRSMKLQIPHGDIPVFCFTDAETVSVRDNMVLHKTPLGMLSKQKRDARNLSSNTHLAT